MNPIPNFPHPPMKPQTATTYPEPSTKCSRITLNVTIDYTGEPFIAPAEWLYRDILSHALNNERTISLDANCVSHVRWVDIPTLRYCVGGEVFTTTREDEFDYRLQCEEREVTPSKHDFWAYMLAKKHLVKLL